jgi:phosphomannomutase
VDPNQRCRTRLEELIRSKDTKELEGLFPEDSKDRLEFGTAGLRAAFGPGPLRMNDVTVMQTAAGLLRQLNAEFGSDHVSARGIVIGYDHRASTEWGLSSKRFAIAAASIFLAAGVDKLYLMDDICPTPFVPFAIQQHGCVAGFMMTASHNPKQDAGFKVYWANACQLVSPTDDLVAKKILSDLKLDPKAVALLNEGETKFFAKCELSRGLVARTTEAYIQACTSKLCRFKSENGKRMKGRRVCYTAMHGVGQPVFERLHGAFGFEPVVSVPEQANPDFEFPTVRFPNPEEKGALDLATAFADKNGCGLVLANDPDADRLAVAEKGEDGKWVVFTGDEIAMLLAWWELEMFDRLAVKDKKPAMVVSAVSSGFVKAMGEQRGCEVHEALTGFKWIGTKAKDLREHRDMNVLFSYEEAIGFCVGDVICDKDGISASCVFAELYAHLAGASAGRKALLGPKLDQLRQEYGYYFTQNHYIKTDSPKAFFERMRNNGRYALMLGGNKFKVTRVRDLAKTTFVDTQDGQPKLPAASSMITFWVEPFPSMSRGYSARVTLRASGTEPKLKYYAEASGPDKDQVKRICADLVESAVLGDLLAPSTSATEAKL